MSKVTGLCAQLGDCSQRRTDLRFRVAESMRYAFVAAQIIKWVNEIAEVSEKIGQLKAGIEVELAKVSDNDRAAVTLAGMSEFGAEEGGLMSTVYGLRSTCVECGKHREVDTNGRCSECSLCVAGAGA